MRILAVLTLLVVVPAAVTWSDEPLKSAAEASVGSIANLGFVAVPESAGKRFQVILEGSEKNKTGIASVEWRRDQENFRLLFAGPLDAGSKEAVPLTLDGLGAGARAELTYSRLSWRGPDLLEQREMKKICAEKLRYEPTPERAAQCLGAQRRIESCQSLGCGPAREAAQCECRAATQLGDECEAERKAAVKCEAERLAPEDQALFRQLNHENDALWYVATSASAARNEFRYLAGEALEPASAIHNDWSITARAGRFTDAFGFVVGSYAYARSFEPARSTQVCRPLRADGSLRCQQAALGVPTKATASVATLELRKTYGSIAINPFVQRDFEARVTAVVVPIYFLKGAEGLTGGVRGAWRSDAKSVTISVFIGGAFSLLPD